MPITQEQIDQFSDNPVPKYLNLSRDPDFDKVLRGKEALAVKVKSPDGTNLAFKRYASLSGKTIPELTKYADGVNKDEVSLRRLSLIRGQVPDTHFVIGSIPNTNCKAELFAIQPWIEGRPLRDIPILEILKNRRLRKNLGALFILCGRLYRKEGITPDLTGGKRISIFGHDVVDPTGFLWPFRTTNVIIRDNMPIIVDAKHNNPSANPIKRLAVLTHWRISQLTGQILIRI